MIKICLDTNIFVSALLFGGQPEEILFMARDKKIELIVSPAILDELKVVLIEKFAYSELDVKKMLEAVASISTIIVPKRRIHKIKYNPDNRILETSIEGKVDYIVTGDKKHLLLLKNFQDIPIVTCAQFLKLKQQ